MAAHKLDKVPKLLKFLGLHAMLGVIIGIALGAALLYADVAGLGTLLLHSDMPVLASALYFSGFAVTFGNAAMGSAIMLMPLEEE